MNDPKVSRAKHRRKKPVGPKRHTTTCPETRFEAIYALQEALLAALTTSHTRALRMLTEVVCAATLAAREPRA